MTKRQSKILGLIHKNPTEGASVERICKELSMSKTVLMMEIDPFIAMKVVKESPEGVFKPSGGKINMIY